MFGINKIVMRVFEKMEEVKIFYCVLQDEQ